MASNVIPKEQLSAYQRWELASFGDERPKAAASVQREPEVDPAVLARQNEERLARLREEAQMQGYAAGLEQGRAAGLEEGRALAEQETARLQAIADAFNSEVTRANDLIAEDLLNLALDVSKAMLKTALTVRPELVLPIISEAIRYLPTVQQPAQLVLHPEDAQLVQQHMGSELTQAGWRISEDRQMERGGCRVETASNQIDAATASRWQRIAEALGKQSEWLE